MEGIGEGKRAFWWMAEKAKRMPAGLMDGHRLAALIRWVFMLLSGGPV